MKPKQRCTATNRQDGDRCGRLARPGTMLCSVHDSSLGPTPIMGVAPVEPAELYQKLMRDKDPAIRLRALEGFQKMEERQTRCCAACTQRAEQERSADAYLEKLTPEDRQELSRLLAPFVAFKERIYQRHPETRPAWSSVQPDACTQESQS